MPTSHNAGACCISTLRHSQTRLQTSLKASRISCPSALSTASRSARREITRLAVAHGSTQYGSYSRPSGITSFKTNQSLLPLQHGHFSHHSVNGFRDSVSQFITTAAYSFPTSSIETTAPRERLIDHAPQVSSTTSHSLAAEDATDHYEELDGLISRSPGQKDNDGQEQSPQPSRSLEIGEDQPNVVINYQQMLASQLGRRTAQWEKLCRSLLQFTRSIPAERAHFVHKLDAAATSHGESDPESILADALARADLHLEMLKMRSNNFRAKSKKAPNDDSGCEKIENASESNQSAAFTATNVEQEVSDALGVTDSEKTSHEDFVEKLLRLLSEEEWRRASDFISNHRARNGATDTVILNHILASIVNKRKRAFFVPMGMAVRFVQKHQVAPDWLSWVLMLRIAPSKVLKQQLLRTLHSKGFDLNTVPITSSSTIIHYSLRPFLERGGNPSTFVETLFGFYGPLWINAEAISAFVEVLVEFAAFDDVVQFLRHLSERRYYTPDVALLNHLLNWCRRVKNVEQAVQFVHIFENLWTVTPNTESIDIVFKLAQNERYFNVTRVAWKYACFEGQPSYGAQRVMFRLLFDGICKSTTSGKRRWRAMAGFVIVGTQPPKIHNPKKVTPYINNLLQEEQKVAEFYCPSKDFAECVKSALELDAEWTRTGKRNSGTLHALLASTIPIHRIIRRSLNS